MDESTFLVGPADDPDRYRLTHLLGSGGEGEVWRAVRRGQNVEVAIKIDAMPSEPGSAWEQRLAMLSELKIDGLVRVQEAFTGAARHRIDDTPVVTQTHRYVVMEHVNGITLRTWLDEHPDAPAHSRIRILRGVARTLTALHRATGSITHGDVKPSNVIITADGRPVLVDLGLIRPAGSGPVSGRSVAYSSPELRNPDAEPSPSADTFSFAVTAMETLTALTPPLETDGTLDLDKTRQRIATAPALRSRPVVRRQLLRSLVVQPERRPRTPIRIFAGRTAAGLLVPALVLVGAGGSAFALRSNTAPPASSTPNPTKGTTLVLPPTASPSPTASKSPSPSASPTAVLPRILRIDHGSMLIGTMDGGTEYMFPDVCGRHESNVVTDPMPQYSTWGGSKYRVSLTSKYDLHVISVRAHPTRAKGPARLTQTLGVTCAYGTVSPPTSTPPCPRSGKNTYRHYAQYRGNADRGTWDEVAGTDTRPFGINTYRCSPPSVLKWSLDDCSTNANYSVTVRFTRDGDSRYVYERTFPVIRLRARATSALFKTSLEGWVTNSVRFSGGPLNCLGKGAKRAVPYTDEDDEIYALMLKGIRQIRDEQPSLTRTEAIEAFINRITLDGELRVYPPFDADNLAQICESAETDKTRWRGDCYEADPTPTASPTP